MKMEANWAFKFFLDLSWMLSVYKTPFVSLTGTTPLPGARCCLLAICFKNRFRLDLKSPHSDRVEILMPGTHAGTAWDPVKCSRIKLISDTLDTYVYHKSFNVDHKALHNCIEVITDALYRTTTETTHIGHQGNSTAFSKHDEFVKWDLQQNKRHKQFVHSVYPPIFASQHLVVLL